MFFGNIIFILHTRETNSAKTTSFYRSWIPSNRISFPFHSFRPHLFRHKLRRFVYAFIFMRILLFDGNVRSPITSRYKRNCSAQRKLLRFHVPGASYRIIIRNPVSMRIDAENHARWVRIEKLLFSRNSDFLFFCAITYSVNRNTLTHTERQVSEQMRGCAYRWANL